MLNAATIAQTRETPTTPATEKVATAVLVLFLTFVFPTAIALGTWSTYKTVTSLTLIDASTLGVSSSMTTALWFDAVMFFSALGAIALALLVLMRRDGQPSGKARRGNLLDVCDEISTGFGEVVRACLVVAVVLPMVLFGGALVLRAKADPQPEVTAPAVATALNDAGWRTVGVPSDEVSAVAVVLTMVTPGNTVCDVVVSPFRQGASTISIDTTACGI